MWQSKLGLQKPPTARFFLLHAEAISETAKILRWVCMDCECSPALRDISENTERKFFSFCNLKIKIFTRKYLCIWVLQIQVYISPSEMKGYIQWHLTAMWKYQADLEGSCEIVSITAISNFLFFPFLSLASMIKLKKKKKTALYIIQIIFVNVLFKLKFSTKLELEK